MSTREHRAWEAVTAPPSTSMALVPLKPDHAPVPPPARPAGQPGSAHRFFYGLGYTALGMIVLGAFLEPRIGAGSAGFFAPAAMMLGIAGLGVMIHVLYRPSLPKLRKGLGAIAAVALTAAAFAPINRVGQEVHGAARIPRLQALADDLVRDGRVHGIGVASAEWVSLNGYEGRLDSSQGSVSNGMQSPSLYEVLRRDGISRLELVRLMRRVRAAGVREVGVHPGFVVFEMDAGPDIFYVRPGHPGTDWSGTRPLGGGWYLLMGRRWED